MGINLNGSGLPIYAGDNYKTYEDTSFETGDSPATLDINADLGRNAGDGWIAVDGPGNIIVQLTQSDSASASFGDNITLKSGDNFSLTGLNINRIKLTWVSNSAYRIFVQ